MTVADDFMSQLPSCASRIHSKTILSVKWGRQMSSIRADPMPLTRAGLEPSAAQQQANFEFSCPFMRLQFGAVRKARQSHEEHEGTRRCTKKTDLEKHLCGLSNLKSIGRTRRRESTGKPFPYKIPDNDFPSCTSCILRALRDPKSIRI